MTLASIIKQRKHELLETYSDRLTPAMRRLIDAVLLCRTERAGKSLPDYPPLSAMVRPKPSNPSIGDRYSRKRFRKIITLHTATSYNSS